MYRSSKVLAAVAVWIISSTAAPPVITSTPVTAAVEDAVYSYTTSASDADNDALTWSVKSGTALPTWLSFSSTGSSTTTNFVTGISNPGGVGYDENTGYTYFAVTDANGTIYKADANGNKSVFGTCGTSTSPLPVGNMIISGTTLYVSCHNSGKIVKFDLTNQSGTATPTLLTSITGPVGMALKDGELYVVSWSLGKIVKVDMTTGAQTLFFTIAQPFGLVFNSNGDCFISLYNAHKVLKRTSTGDTSTVVSLPGLVSDIKIGRNGKFYISQYNTADLRIYESNFASYQSIPVSSWGMTFNNSGTLIFGEANGTRLLKLETGAVLSGTPANSDVGTHNVALSVTDGLTTVNHEFTITVSNTNDAPTSSNRTIAVTTQYTFSSADFAFTDIDPTSDVLTSVKITSLPVAGSLKYFGTNVTVNKVIPKDSLGQLVFTPVVGASGSPYTTFGYQVGDGTTYSSSYTMTINVTAVPTVSTSAIASITTSSATLGGNVISSGSLTVTERGIVYSTVDSTPEIGENGVTKDENGTGTGAFNESIGGLLSGTKYYVRAYATNSVGTNYGTMSSFTTLMVPIVTTQAVSSITMTTATGNGSITNPGIPNPTAHGVCWNTSGTPTLSDFKIDNGAISAAGAFTCSITGLTSGTKYYVRAYATNSAGTSYGLLDSFTTLQASVVTTQPVSSMIETSAVVNGSITVLGVPNPAAYGICWNTSGTPTTSDFKVDKGSASSTGDFTCTMSGLTAGLTYYYRAFVTNDLGTSYGDEVHFTTTLNSQTITFNTLDAETYGDVPFNLNASSSSGLTISYLSSNSSVAVISGSTVTIIGSGSTTITAKQEGNSAYAAAPNVDQILTVNAKSLTITGLSGVNKMYDGTITASLSGTAALSGLESSDTGNVTLGGTPVATFADAAVGTAKAITVSGYNISGVAAENYAITQLSSISASITGKSVTVTGLSGVNKIYDGTTTASLSGTAALSGVVPIDTNNVILGGTPVATFADTRVGTAKAISVSGYAINGSAAGNYILTQPQGLTADVSQIPLQAPIVTSIFDDTMRVGTTVRLCWTTVTDAQGYHIQLSSDSIFTSLRIDTLVGNTSRFFADELGVDSIWYFRIAAFNESSTSPWTAIYHLSTLPAEVVHGEEYKEKVTIQIIDSIESPLPGVSVHTSAQNDFQGLVVTVIEAKDILSDTSIEQVTRVYDFTRSAQTTLQDSITLTFAIPDTFLDGSAVSDLLDIRIYEIDSAKIQRVIFNPMIDTTARTISYRTNHFSAVTVAFDRVFPSVVDNTPRVPSTSGSAPEIKGQITDNVGNCRVFAYFRRGGAYEYDSLPVTIDTNGSFSLSLTNSALDLNGFEYFIAAYDGTNRVTVDRQDIPVKVTAVVDSTPMPSMQWRLFSTPVNLSANDISAFFRNMGEYGRAWKLFRRSLISAIDSFVEYGPNLNILGTGFSYWIKSYKNAIQLSVDSGVTTPVSRCYETVIPAKTWAAVANPYMFPVGWQKIIDSSAAGTVNLIGPYTYEDSAWIPPSQIDKIVPWRGYYVYNSSESVITMRIPSLKYRESQGVTKRAAKKSTSLEWIVSCKDGRDYRNYFGFLPEATDDYDAATDFPKAGAPGSDAPVVWFHRAGLSKIASRFQTDFTSMNNGGAVWTSSIANLRQGTTYQCKITGFADLPDSVRCIIIDKHAGISHDVRDGVYHFSPLENEKVREMELVVGTEGFIDRHVKGLRLLPTKLTLSTLMRNGIVIVNYALPWSASVVPVKLSILDLQGRLVTTLSNERKQYGYHSVSWDMRKTGNASGIYLIQLKAGKHQMIVKEQVVK